MIQRVESGISPTISVILLIFLTLVLIGASALLFFSFTGDTADPKHLYLTAEATGSSADPLMIHLWKTGGGSALKSVYVSVSTPAGIFIGTPDPAQESFFEGMSIPIGFDTGFPKGSYFVTVTGVFADGTTQVLLTKTMCLEAEGQAIQEVNTEKLILVATYAAYKPTRIGLKDITTYTNITNISHWTLNLGYTGADTEELLVPVNVDYVYPIEAFAGSSEKEFVITYTAYYTGGKTKTTAEIKIKLYTSVPEDTIGKYVGNYKIGGESLQGTGDSAHHIPLIGTTSTEIWRTDIAGRYINVDGQNLPALQINLNDPKTPAASVTITCDTEFRVGSTQYFTGGGTYDGNLSTFYPNTANRSSISVTLSVYDINKTKLAEQTTLIIIRE
ncbi:hypothetical protein SDC9_39594 [bioreactor metagenome]|uniref:Archaeal Type IV pilin N-terminal domain-containing protein n=1 Tax=bioreactor metagenome TaxID=1076179 RepID=A0A644VQ43_9ZZZZ|nr:hypothetical protein [Methanocorpusculum sp.]